MNTHHHAPRPGLRLVSSLVLIFALYVLAVVVHLRSSPPQIVYNADTAETLASFPKGYRVDGAPGTAAPPIYVLDVIRVDRPEEGVDYDPATHHVRRLEPVVDLSAGTISHGWELVPWSTAELAAIANPPISTRTFVRRLTSTEIQLLATSANPSVIVFRNIALAGDTIDPLNADTVAAAGLLDSLGIIASERWPTLLAPE